MKPAPVALFVFNRPTHTARTLDALAANELALETDLFVFSDASEDARDAESVRATRDLAANASGFNSVTLIAREHHCGLAASITEGVSQLAGEHGKVIVIEDDIETSPHFLRYMNDALTRYADDENVFSISGYRYPIGEGLPGTFFLRSTSSWGWATWKRAWDHYEPDGSRLLETLRQQRLLHRFNYGGFPYQTVMLKRQIAGRNDSWAIRWYASALLNRGLTLYPCSSLVRNIGFDDTGFHSPTSNIFAVELADRAIDVSRIDVEENREAVRRMRAFWWRFALQGCVRSLKERLRLPR